MAHYSLSAPSINFGYTENYKDQTLTKKITGYV
jgi:hypothetical protein